MFGNSRIAIFGCHVGWSYIGAVWLRKNSRAAVIKVVANGTIVELSKIAGAGNLGGLVGPEQRSLFLWQGKPKLFCFSAN
jgi:hypothetical protein